MSRATAAGLWCWCLTLVCAGAAWAQAAPGADSASDSGGEALPLLVDLELSSEEITVGDRVEATLMVVWMGGETAGPARFPTWQASWGRAEVLATGEVSEVSDASGRRIWKQAVTLTAFRPGMVALPPVKVALPLEGRTVEASTEEAEFTVGSVLPQPAEPASSATADDNAGSQAAGAPAEIPEPKGPAATVDLDSRQRNFWWTAGALSALLAACLVWTAGAVAGQPAEAQPGSEPVDPLRLLSPFDELRERLARLDPAAGSEPLHTGLSFALRTYLGRRLHFRAAQSTTTEIQRALRRANLSAEVNLRAVRLLRDADAVKFARAEVAPKVAERRLAEAGDLARHIEHEMAPTPRLEAESAGTEAQAA